jgi:structural maintenance of chromosome 3 (chondroitin sulfate proteoglycan 6)
LEKQVEDLSAEIAEVTKQLDEVQSQQLEAARQMLLYTKQSERFLAKKQTLSSRKEASQNAIRDLGVLPEEAYNKYTEARSDKVSLRYLELSGPYS